MNASILLCSALLGGGQGETTYVVQPQVVYSRPVQQSKPTVLSNMRSRLNQLFGKQQPVQTYSQPTQYIYPAGQPAMVTEEPPTASGIQQSSHREFVPSQYRPIPQGPKAAEAAPMMVDGQEHVFQVKNQFQNKIGRADDCSWITGQLFYVHADGGKWILRYSAVDEEDKYGGSVVLAPAVNMKNFREGDLVSVTGHLLSEARASKFLGGPLYRLETIDMMERAD